MLKRKAFIPIAVILVIVCGCNGTEPVRKSSMVPREKFTELSSEFRGRLQRFNDEIKRLRMENGKLKKGGARYAKEKKYFQDTLPDIMGLHERDGELAVLLTADILFDPGRSTIKPSARTVLLKLGQALNNDLFRDKALRIEGHTDSDPIKRARKNYRSNWDLGFARANAVMNYLIKNTGLDPTQRTIYPASFSHYKPLDTNKTRTGKARNRRVEVVIIMGR